MHYVLLLIVEFLTLPFLGIYGRTHSQLDECHQNDLQHLVVLQHLRENDLTLCESHQPDDHHL